MQDFSKREYYFGRQLTAISQYVVHSGMCENWGYIKLHDDFQKRTIDEMKNAKKTYRRGSVSRQLDSNCLAQ
jgi:bacterioferritin (cytochrome b1)